MNNDSQQVPNTEKKEYEFPPKPILPSNYPNSHGVKSNAPISSDANVEYAKAWVDYNIK